MTDDRRSTDWPDDRLADAFRARADAHPTPSDLSAATIGRIHLMPGVASPDRRFAYLGGFVAAAAVVALIASVALVRPLPEPGNDTSTALGLPILSVDEAIAVRGEDVTDREIVVRGYLVPAALGRRCGASSSAVINPVRLDCPYDTQWLLHTPTPLDGIRTSLPPGRIGFQPLLPGLDTSLLTEAADRGQAARSLVEVVLIGHFHDRRGHPALCGVADASACDGFVADGIYSVGGDRIQPSTLIELPASRNAQVRPTWTADDVDRLILEAVPRLQILSRVALAGSDIPSLEPALGTGALGVIDRPFAWLVTGLDPGTKGQLPLRRTFLLVDGTAEAYESAPWDVSNVGFVPFHLVALPLASEEPSPSPSIAPPGATDSTVVGPPMTVSEAIDRRDNHLDDTEILVRGYGWGPPGPIACTPLQVAPPALDQCPDGSSWIGERKPVGSAPEFLQPDGPAFNLLVREWTYVGSNLRYRPRQILALGHFDDPQAKRCAPELVERCRRNFLVDAILDPTRGWPVDNASSPGLTCADGITIPDCAAAASAVIDSLSVNDGGLIEIEVGRGVWCPTPGLLFENTSCPAGGMPPTEGGQWIGHALVTFGSSPAQEYVNISRSGSVVRATSIAHTTPPPSPN
jgi:hypothetical protein